MYIRNTRMLRTYRVLRLVICAAFALLVFTRCGSHEATGVDVSVFPESEFSPLEVGHPLAKSDLTFPQEVLSVGDGLLVFDPDNQYYLGAVA